MKITIVGGGNMGLAFARSFIKYEIVQRNDLLLVAKSDERKHTLETLNIGRVIASLSDEVATSDIVLLSVKPQDYPSIVPALKSVIKPNNVVLSIMAGIRMATIEKDLDHTNIVRAMTNSPAELGLGMTAYTNHPSMDFNLIRKAESLLSSAGRIVYLEREDLLDAVTALSGSGPAYFYYFLKHMVDVGKQMGFEEATSTMLVKQTMIGAYHLVNNATKSLDELIKIVASKGGTTEAALKVFEENNLGASIEKGILAAEKRAKELSK